MQDQHCPFMYNVRNFHPGTNVALLREALITGPSSTNVAPESVGGGTVLATGSRMQGFDLHPWD